MWHVVDRYNGAAHGFDGGHGGVRRGGDRARWERLLDLLARNLR